MSSAPLVRAPTGVRLPPHTLRFTTAGRIACSAFQFVASIRGFVRNENQWALWFHRCFANRSFAGVAGRRRAAEPHGIRRLRRAGARAMAVGAVVSAGLAAGGFGFRLGRPFAEGRGLAFAGLPRFVAFADQVRDLGLERGHALLRRQATRTNGLVHAAIVGTRPAISCASFSTGPDRHR